MIAPRILILDAHTNQALACARSLGKAGYEIFVASTRRHPLASWSKYSLSSFLLKDEDVESYAQLRNWAAVHGIGIVLPLTERACSLCNAERGLWESSGIIVGCGEDEMLQRAFDKSKTLQLANECGVAIPPTYFPNSLEECFEAASETGFPCVIKPRWSTPWPINGFAGHTGTPKFAYRKEDLEAFVLECRQNDSWPIIQGFVPGTGKGVFMLLDHGRLIAHFAHERLRETRPSGSASSLRKSVKIDPRLGEPATRLLSAMKWHGPAMVEFKDDGVNEPWLMEVNGRFWGSLQLAIDAGVDFPVLWVSILEGKTPEPRLDYRDDATLRWLLGDVKRFARILRGPQPGFKGKYPGIGQGLCELLGSQPAGTRLEILRSDDPKPAIGECFEGGRELWKHLTKLNSKN